MERLRGHSFEQNRKVSTGNGNGAADGMVPNGKSNLVIGKTIADGLPNIMFHPNITMNEEMKEQLIFAVFIAEAAGKTDSNRATHIVDKMRGKYRS